MKSETHKYRARLGALTRWREPGDPEVDVVVYQLEQEVFIAAVERAIGTLTYALSPETRDRVRAILDDA